MGLWEQQLAKGKAGESIVKNLMIARGHEVKDISNDSSTFDDDIDFIIDGKTCELKTDAVIAGTGNLFLEDTITYKSNKANEKGYFRKSKAEYLFYLDSKNKILYIYSLEELRSYVKQQPPYQRAANDSYKVVYGYCLNKDAVRHDTIKIE